MEGIEQRLYDCKKIRILWETLTTWLRTYTVFKDQMYLGKYSILLGDQRNNVLVNQSTIITKNEIYNNKYNNKPNSTHTIKVAIKTQMISEKYVANTSNKLRTFLGNGLHYITIWWIRCWEKKVSGNIATDCTQSYCSMKSMHIIYNMLPMEQ